MDTRKTVRVVAAMIERGVGPDREILITERPAGKEFAGFWEFPGGKVEPGESDADALRRELIEELAIDVEVGRRYYSNVFEYAGFILDFVLYSCRYDGNGIVAAGVSAWTWVRPQDLLQYRFPPADAIVVKQLAEQGKRADL